jgi:hypothetical protein
MNRNQGTMTVGTVRRIPHAVTKAELVGHLGKMSLLALGAYPFIQVGTHLRGVRRIFQKLAGAVGNRAVPPLI